MLSAFPLPPLSKATLPVLGFEALPPGPACRSGDCTPGFREGEGMHSSSSVAEGSGVSHGKSPADQGTAVGGSAPSLEKEGTQFSLLLSV